MPLAQRLRDNKWIILIVAVGIFLFYWYEIRPITVYRSCARQSSADARTLLGSKAEIAQGTPRGESYKQLQEKNMYLRSDYESFLKKCLLNYGFQDTGIDDASSDENTDGADAPSAAKPSNPTTAKK